MWPLQQDFKKIDLSLFEFGEATLRCYSSTQGPGTEFSSSGWDSEVIKQEGWKAPALTGCIPCEALSWHLVVLIT